MQPDVRSMEHLNLAEVEARFQTVLTERAFQAVEEQSPESMFGASRTYENEELRLRFVIDRGHPYHYVQATPSGEPLGLDSVYHWLVGERPSVAGREKVAELAALLGSRYGEVVRAVRDDVAEVAAAAARFEEAWRRRWNEEAG